MLVFNKFLIFLIVFICETNEIRYPYNTYLTGISGKLGCKYGLGRGATITIYKKGRTRYKDKVISSIYVGYYQQFLISGSLKSFWQPDLYVKIHHICVRSRVPYIRIYDTRIENKYVTKLGKRGHFWIWGFIELSKLRGENIPYPKKKQAKF